MTVISLSRGGRAEVDYALGVRTLHAVGVHVGHDVVADELLALGRNVIVDVVGVSLELVDLLPGHGQSELHLCLGKRYPQPSPGAELLVG